MEVLWFKNVFSNTDILVTSSIKLILFDVVKDWNEHYKKLKSTLVVSAPDLKAEGHSLISWRSK